MDDINSLLTSSLNSPEYSIGVILFNLFISFLLSAMVAFVYQRTHKGVSYSQSFVFTLVIVSTITCAAMMVIGNSITRAFALLGTFSIIRFRTAMKDTKDTAYVFMVLVIGIAVGTGNYLIATLSTLIMLLIIYVLSVSNFGSVRKYDYVLSFILDANQSDSEVLKKILDDNLKRRNLISVRALKDGKKIEHYYDIQFKKSVQITKFSSRLSKVKGLSEANILTAKNDIEY